MPYKYGPGDPEFLDHEPLREPATTQYFHGFGRKLAILDWLLLIALGVAALILGWNLHRFASAVALAGVGLIGAAMLLVVGNQSFSNFGLSGAQTYNAWVRLPVDGWAQRVSVLPLVAGLSFALPGVALIVLTA